MSTTCGMLRLAARNYSSPSEMLQRVNEALFPYIPANMFVTCFYAILDPKSGSLTYANAGHDLPYLHRNGEAEELRARGMPLVGSLLNMARQAQGLATPHGVKQRSQPGRRGQIRPRSPEAPEHDPRIQPTAHLSESHRP